MKPGDIVLWRDGRHGCHRLWQIEGVYLGCEGQESLVEIRNLLEKPGVNTGISKTQTVFVPEPLIRNLVYTPDVK